MKKILIVLPTYNEELVIKENTLKVFQFCQEKLKNYDWQILIADNGSTDGTPQIAKQLTESFSGGRLPTNYPAIAVPPQRDPALAVRPRLGGGESERQPKAGPPRAEITNKILFFHIPDKGRGYALKKAWGKEYPADFYAYMDADLSSDLNVFPLLIEALENPATAVPPQRDPALAVRPRLGGGYHLATGSRLKSGHQTERSLAREILSRGYNLLLKILFKPTFEDAQCGFKAITEEVAQKILPQIKNNNWFFDTELFVLAENAGYKIKEIPIEWLEKRQIKRKSTVKILSTVWEDIKGMAELRLRLLLRIRNTKNLRNYEK